MQFLWPVLVGAGALVACNREEGVVARTGEIALKYESLSRRAAIFVLENGTTQAVAVRADHTFWGRTIPWDTAMVCTAAHSTREDETSMALSDGFPKIVSLPPGNRMQLRVEGDDVSFAVGHKGGSCRLRLRLQNGSTIESVQFEP
jgi:hypothetical protein